MILYTLACDAGHPFESWFRDSAAYDVQRMQGLIVCPTCRSTEVSKTIMAPAIVGATSEAFTSQRAAAQRVDAPLNVAILDEKSQKLRTLFKEIRDKVVAEGHDVGAEFAAEARRIHDGEAPLRQIYGQASKEEARDLLEEGIMILPMPTAPEELN